MASRSAAERVARFVVHVGERPRQRDRARLAVAGARIDKHAGAGRLLQFLRKVAPQADAAEALVQHHQRRRRAPAADRSCGIRGVRADGEEAGVVRFIAHKPLIRHGRA